MFNDTITIYNAYPDPIKKDVEYLKTVLVGVSWEAAKISNAIKSGYQNADSFSVVIPISVALKYKSPKEYKALPKDEASLYFTLQEGDKIVKGDISDNPSPITEIEKKYDNVMTINKIDIKDMAINSYLNHIEVSGT
jgi:hypothetical protein